MEARRGEDGEMATGRGDKVEASRERGIGEGGRDGGGGGISKRSTRSTRDAMWGSLPVC